MGWMSYRAAQIFLLISAIVLGVYGVIFIIVLWSIAGTSMYQTSNVFNSLKFSLLGFGVGWGIMMIHNWVIGILLGCLKKSRCTSCLNILYQIICYLLFAIVFIMLIVIIILLFFSALQYIQLSNSNYTL